MSYNPKNLKKKFRNREALVAVKMADSRWRLTWHNVLHVILLFPLFFLAQANGGREEKNGAGEGNADGQPREDVRPVVPYR